MTACGTNETDIASNEGGNEGYSVDEIKNALKRVGFELVCVYQAFTKTAPDFHPKGRVGCF